MGGYAEKFIHHSNCELFPEFASEYFGDNVLQNLGFLVINCPHNAAGTPHNGYTVRGAYDQAQYNVALYNWCIFVSHVFRAECGAALSDVNYYSRRQLCAGKMLAYANMLGDAKLQQYSMLVMAKLFCYNTDVNAIKWHVMGELANYGNAQSGYLSRDDESFRQDIELKMTKYTTE